MRHWFFIFCFLYTVSFAAYFKDKKGYYSISDLSAWRTTKIDNNRVQFKGSGHPLKAVYKFPNISLKAQEIEGVLQLKPTPCISTLEIKKDVYMELIGTEKRKTFLTCAVVNYNAPLSKILLPEPFKLTSSYLPSAQTITIEGKKGEFYLYPSTSKKVNLLSKGFIKGPIFFTINTLSKSSGDKYVSLLFKGQADEMSFDDIKRTIILKGNILIDTDQESFSGTLNADSAILSFDQDYQILDMQLDGESGKSTLIPKKAT